jgi:ABC-type uncharacterized transport system substrate-binding protein
LTRPLGRQGGFIQHPPAQAGTNFEAKKSMRPSQVLCARLDAFFVAIDPFLISRRARLVNLASRHSVPVTFPSREFTEIGGLMSYGANIPDAYHQVGVYAARVLMGAKPEADLERELGLTLFDRGYCRRVP